MINELIFEGPLNPLSMGNVSINILKSLYKKGIKVYFSPIGQSDINNYNLSDDFKNWLQNAANSFLKNYKRDLATIRNWHLNGSWSFPSDKKYLLTYHETDSATPEELNIIKNINKVFFCGNYSPKIFSEYGADNIDSFNLGFDNDSFNKVNKVYFNDGRIQWFLGGKLEKRKATLNILKIWIKKYGKKEGESFKAGEQIHFLNAVIMNPFLDANVQQQQIQQVLGGRYINVQFFGFLPREAFNDLKNASDIDLTGLSLSESWNLPSFNMSALGKWSIVLNAHGHKSWANKDNSILVSPNGKTSIVDNIFFQANAPFSVGNCYTWDENEVIKAMDLAVNKAKTPNIEGEKLKEEFTYDKSVDYILTKVEEDLNKK